MSKIAHISRRQWILSCLRKNPTTFLNHSDYNWESGCAVVEGGASSEAAAAVPDISAAPGQGGAALRTPWHWQNHACKGGLPPSLPAPTFPLLSAEKNKKRPRCGIPCFPPLRRKVVFVIRNLFPWYVALQFDKPSSASLGLLATGFDQKIHHWGASPFCICHV